ncbi:MAG TPA: thioredoxin-disulfide reductase [Nitrospirae bacterium]|nr:thioredoxin reductase [bacterium BMS3Abin06]HDH13637.1 thioredoxin-disulfide reductase [Nitrospirota bacterium]HDZ00907.1 thioredoxin-disulfide reductase [Nitrospirota bacterium]
MYDTIIIGGGPAGLTAGLYTSRARLKSLLIEKGFTGGQVMTTEWVENYPGFEEGVSGAELSQKMEKQATKFGLEIIQGSVADISLNDNIKKITLEDNTQYETKSIILATGSNPRPLKIEGEDTFRGRGVSYCATCDGAFFKDEKLAVIGGGDSAVEEGLFLTKFAETVYIIHRRDRLRATKVLQERAFANPKIKLVWDSVPEKIAGDDSGVQSLHIKNIKTAEQSRLEVRGVFIYVGYNPNTGFLKGLVNLNENNYIITDENMSTSTPGIFAAGDVRAKPLKQIATAVGDGATAGVAAEKYIEGNF